MSIAQAAGLPGLHQLFDTVALSCIVGSGDAHLKNFGVLYRHPQLVDGTLACQDCHLAPVYDVVNTTAYFPQEALALELRQSKSLFAARLGLLEFAQTCNVANPKDRIENILQCVEQVLVTHADLAETVTQVTKAIQASAEAFATTFGHPAPAQARKPHEEALAPSGAGGGLSRT
ncbi:HipA domain-containing protein [Pseudomonas cavernae]|uniref:HipA domain-containing protein n=1 Tax=Pseudomonas cavernae TaxID=2320867 RepID=A0A385YX04_9PSED|nr:HipA domain-containing protein [Pseudomonas cavernae]AYC30981.1 HipA domain-containing protein [Pseudomonas cavernae]